MKHIKHNNDDHYMTRDMTRALLREDEYVTRTMLREELEIFEARFEAKLDAKLDYKLEVMHRRIIEDMSAIMHDMMERHLELHHSGDGTTSKINKRLTNVEGKLHKASTALR